ncbi:hypothetical protein CRENBAI_024988 [Crenichthys baileyi]|uniref:Uncharacterized protein n=1 Tax=Crenichthys baileyi TaxID=28760 RepID=A0AAV9RPA5_9TELE
MLESEIHNSSVKLQHILVDTKVFPGKKGFTVFTLGKFWVNSSHGVFRKYPKEEGILIRSMNHLRFRGAGALLLLEEKQFLTLSLVLKFRNPMVEAHFSPL